MICPSVFFEHERGQKIGLWVLSINTGLMVGPIGKSKFPSKHFNILTDTQSADSWTQSAQCGSTG